MSLPPGCCVRGIQPQNSGLSEIWTPNPSSISLAELNQWQREGVVDYLGQLEDVRQAIKACSVYVLPSYREGTPRTVLEAMSMGRAIITANSPGVPGNCQIGIRRIRR